MLLVRRVSILLALAAAALLPVRPAAAQCVSLTTLGSAVTQNFDTLSNVAGIDHQQPDDPRLVHDRDRGAAPATTSSTPSTPAAAPRATPTATARRPARSARWASCAAAR